MPKQMPSTRLVAFTDNDNLYYALVNSLRTKNNSCVQQPTVQSMAKLPLVGGEERLKLQARVIGLRGGGPR